MGVIRIFLIMFIFHLSMCGAVFSTPLTNGDFSSGFSGWDGFLDSTGYVDPDIDSHFSIDGGMAKLARTSIDDWWVVLSQDIDIPLLAQTISFDFEWFFTEYNSSPGSSQEVQASIVNMYTPFPTIVANLFEGLDYSVPNSSGTGFSNTGTVTADISGLAGETRTLEFMVMDNDLSDTDWLKIGNIQITMIPEPGTMILFAMGLVLACRITGRRSV